MMANMDLVSLAVPVAEICAVIGLFIKLHTAPRFAQQEASLDALKLEVASLREQLARTGHRLEDAEQRHADGLLKLRSEVGEVTTKAHDRINPIERDIARLMERTRRGKETSNGG
jgi:predicted  nucleic acid-binding Zn-ribbon protein